MIYDMFYAQINIQESCWMEIMVLLIHAVIKDCGFNVQLTLEVSRRFKSDVSTQWSLSGWIGALSLNQNYIVESHVSLENSILNSRIHLSFIKIQHVSYRFCRCRPIYTIASMIYEFVFKQAY